MQTNDIPDGKRYVSARAFLTVFLIVFFIIAADSASAHKVMIFAWAQGNKIYTESKFSGGRKVKGGEIVVSDSQGNQLLRGRTDDGGEFSFEIPQKTSLRIKIIGGMGHRGEWTVPLGEILEASSGETGEPFSTEAKTEAEAEKDLPKKPETILPPESRSQLPHADTGTESALTREDIQAIVEKSLDKKLKPVMKILTEAREQKISLNDIFGGIGYILGLMGIAAYFNYRKKNNPGKQMSAKPLPKKTDR